MCYKKLKINLFSKKKNVILSSLLIAFLLKKEKKSTNCHLKSITLGEVKAPTSYLNFKYLYQLNYLKQKNYFKSLRILKLSLSIALLLASYFVVLILFTTFGVHLLPLPPSCFVLKCLLHYSSCQVLRLQELKVLELQYVMCWQTMIKTQSLDLDCSKCVYM